MKRGVMMQYFEWYLEADQKHWQRVKENAVELASNGFSALWLPPAYKGQAGVNDVGYGVYDLYDLGEFNQKGSIATKYGTKDEYLSAIQALHEQKIQVYADMVFNHKMGADEKEEVEAAIDDPLNRNIEIKSDHKIEAWTKFTFPGRNGKYSSFLWNKDHFNGVDYDDRSKKSAIYRFEDKEWDQDVDQENGNYDYLMGADICFANPEVVDELHRYGKWYIKMSDVDGFRLDALKHIDNEFFESWLQDLRNTTGKELFTMGEYWSPYLDALTYYLDRNHNHLSLFDVPLHFNFYQACNSNGKFNMSKLLENSLMMTRPQNAVTFVENHDTQQGQALQTVIQDWFKPMAYAVILLRKEGYPCVFYGDYYGIKHYQTTAFKEVINAMIKLRNDYMYGNNYDYFDHEDVVGWSFEGDDEHPHAGMAVLIDDGPGGVKDMYVGTRHANQVFYDRMGNVQEEVGIREDGVGTFKVNGGSYSVYIRKEKQ